MDCCFILLFLMSGEPISLGVPAELLAPDIMPLLQLVNRQGSKRSLHRRFDLKISVSAVFLPKQPHLIPSELTLRFYFFFFFLKDLAHVLNQHSVHCMNQYYQELLFFHVCSL